MTGLDKILAQINSDTERTCEDIKNRSIQQCKDVINSATIEAKNIAQKAAENAENIKEDIILRAQSAAELQKSSVMLSAKQQIIARALDNALGYLIDLPQEKYFSLLYDMIEKYSEALDGEIHLSSRDLKRLPVDFLKNINTRSKGNLSLSQKPADIDGGFVLVYGGVDINCGFSALFAAETEHFSDEISRILFG